MHFYQSKDDLVFYFVNLHPNLVLERPILLVLFGPTLRPQGGGILKLRGLAHGKEQILVTYFENIPHPWALSIIKHERNVMCKRPLVCVMCLMILEEALLM